MGMGNWPINKRHDIGIGVFWSRRRDRYGLPRSRVPGEFKADAVGLELAADTAGKMLGTGYLPFQVYASLKILTFD